MNLNLFIAKKIGGRGNGEKKLSSLSNTIACFSVAISILVMFVAICISDGFKKDIKETAVGFSGEILFTAPGQDITNDTYPINSNLSFIPDIQNIKGVKAVNPVAYKPGMVKTDENVQGVIFKGVDSTYSLSFFEKYLNEGNLPDFSTKNVSNDILISKRLADMMGYKVGDPLVAYFIGDNVRVRKFTITGFFSIQLEEIDKTLTLIDIRHTQRLNGWNEEEVSCIEVSLDHKADLEKIEGRIDEIVMEKTTDDDSSIVVKNISNIYPYIFDWLELLNLNVLVILILMIVVASFNMSSGLLIILFEKISMIGLLKALGMKTRDICKVFIIRGSFIILKGMAIGNVIAVILCVLQGAFKIFSLNPANYFVDHIPVYVNVPVILLLNAASFVLMMLIMIIPSLFISRVQPDRTMKMD